MPRSRGSSDMSTVQKQSPRAPLHLKTTACSEANSVQYRSPRLDNDRRSPRTSPLHDPAKKRGTRVADLELKLGQTQEELKKIKEQLATAEAAKREAQQELVEARKLIPLPSEVDEKITDETVDEEPKHEEREESIVLSNPPTPEVSEAVAEQAEDALSCEKDVEEEETKVMIEEPKVEEIESDTNLDDNPVVIELMAKLAEKDKELQSVVTENVFLKIQAAEVASAKTKEDELDLKLSCMEFELTEIRTKAERLKEQLEAAEGAKSTLEAELRTLRVQTDQWRKAAETAAAVLTAGGGEMGMMENNGRRVGERCGSLDKNLGYDVGVGSPLMTGDEDEFNGGKRRSSGIRMFGDLWKKKGQQK